MFERSLAVRALCAAVTVAWLLTGCARSYSPQAGGAAAPAPPAEPAAAPPPPSPAPSGGAGAANHRGTFSRESTVTSEVERRRPVVVAQTGPQLPSAKRGPRPEPPQEIARPQSAPVPPQIIIYAAHFTMAVFEVLPGLQRVEQVGRQLGGFMVQRDDRQIVIRVPAARFQEAVERLEKVGDVVHRNITADDVTEQFRDISIRIRNARAVRDRLQQLLARAAHVKDALEVERELERLAVQIDTLEGRLRFLADRAAYSTLTVVFQPRARELIAKGTFRLPFPWLGRLGLGRLLRLD
jgi:hypothetical protein